CLSPPAPPSTSFATSPLTGPAVRRRGCDGASGLFVGSPSSSGTTGVLLLLTYGARRHAARASLCARVGRAAHDRCHSTGSARGPSRNAVYLALDALRDEALLSLGIGDAVGGDCDLDRLFGGRRHDGADAHATMVADERDAPRWQLLAGRHVSGPQGGAV